MKQKDLIQDHGSQVGGKVVHGHLAPQGHGHAFIAICCMSLKFLTFFFFYIYKV